LKTIVYILLSIAAVIGIIAAVIYFDDSGRKRKEKLKQLEEAREAKASKKLLRDLDNEMSSITENIKSDASTKD